MKVEREVIVDLLPAYFSGEASAATRALVEEYFRENPDFEKLARDANRPLETLKVPASALDEAKEKLALERARQITESRSSFLWLAICFTAILLLFRIHDHKVIWIMWDKPRIGVFFACGTAFFWLLFLSVRRRKQPLQLHTKFLWLAGFYTVLLAVVHFVTPDPDANVVFAVITVILWILYFFQRWKVKRAKL